MRASREGRPLPKDFFANFLAAVAALYPDARLDRASVSDLYNLAVDEWREGRQLHVIVREVCTCDGKSVFPSAGAIKKLGRQPRVARAPLEAEDGAMFGLEELRDSRDAADLKARIARLQRKVQQTEDGIPYLRKTYADLNAAGQSDRAERIAATIANAEQGLEDMRANLALWLKQEEDLLAGRPWSRLIQRPQPKARAARPAKAKAPRVPKPKKQKPAKPTQPKSQAKRVKTASQPEPTRTKVPAKPKPKKEPRQAQTGRQGQVDVGRRQTPAKTKKTIESQAPITSPETTTQLPDLVDDDLEAAFLNSVASRAK